MNKNPSIDEMIKAGKTLPEIQAELRKVVAARDEATLKAQKINKVKEARAAAVKALVNYCLTLGVPMKDEELTSSLDSALASYEKERRRFCAPPHQNRIPGYSFFPSPVPSAGVSVSAGASVSAGVSSVPAGASVSAGASVPAGACVSASVSLQ